MSWKKYTREGGGKFLKKIRKNNLPSEKEDFCSKEKKTTRFLQMHFFLFCFSLLLGHLRVPSAGGILFSLFEGF